MVKSIVVGSLACIGFVAVIGIILLIASYSTVEPTELALDMNGNTKEIDFTEVYTGTREFLGLGHYFITFPKILNKIEISDLPTRTSDGLPVKLDTSFQWKLQPTAQSLYDTYMLFEDRYTAAYEKVAKDKIRNVAARFPVSAFFFDRQNIGASMKVELVAALDPLGCQVESFQLLNFQLPSQFENAIARTQLKQQEIDTKTRVQEKTEIDSFSRTLVAQQEAKITILDSEAAAASFLFDQQARANAINVTLQTERAAYRELADQLQLSPDQLLSYIFMTSIESTSAKQLLSVGLPSQFEGGNK